MTERQIVVVDVETTGLDPHVHVPLEVAWVNLTTGESDTFVPAHTVADIERANPDALRINRYHERGLHDQMLGTTASNRAWVRLGDQLDGHTLAGSNPSFDSAVLGEEIRPSWHHRLLDLSAYTAGVLGLQPTELPGLAKVCELLNVQNTAPHTAMGDASATAECFRRLMSPARRIEGQLPRTSGNLLTGDAPEPPVGTVLQHSDGLYVKRESDGWAIANPYAPSGWCLDRVPWDAVLRLAPLTVVQDDDDRGDGT